MSELLAYLAVLLAAAIPWLEVLLVVPAGILAGLPPVPTAVVGFVGNALTLVPVVVAGDRIRDRWRHRRGPRAEEPATTRTGRARRLFDRYGLPGLAALGPLVTGIHMAAVVALAAGADRGRVLRWLTAGVGLWSVLAAALTVAGVDVLGAPSMPEWWPLGG